MIHSLHDRPYILLLVTYSVRELAWTLKTPKVNVGHLDVANLSF